MPGRESKSLRLYLITIRLMLLIQSKSGTELGHVGQRRLFKHLQSLLLPLSRRLEVARLGVSSGEGVDVACFFPFREIACFGSKFDGDFSIPHFFVDTGGS